MSMEGMAAHILVVDDDRRIRELLQRYMVSSGYRVTAACDAAEAEQRMRGLDFDLIVLDAMMPGEDGLDFAARLRSRSRVPILMLTARAETGDRIVGLERGVDDYLAKPFEPRELLLRIEGILRRVPSAGVLEKVVLGDVVFDPARGELRRKGAVVPLTDQESCLLSQLARSPGEPLSREVLGEGGEARQDRSVDVRINRLRRKIEADPSRPIYLRTVRGKGYVLHPDIVPERGA